MNNKNTLILVAGLMAMVFVAASVFAYYPLSITVSPVEPPVKFVAGNNSNQTDLGPGNTITVILGSNNASASVIIHPTYQKTYYKDVLNITNVDDSKAYNVYIRVNTTITGLAGSTISLKIYDSGASRPGTPIATVDLTSTGTVSIGSLSGGGTWEVDVEVYIPEGSPLPSAATANLQLIYTPSSEKPP
jgi:hypothetical protein